MSDVPTPTPREMEILKVLWELGPLSVRAVSRRLELDKDLAYNTVLTTLRILEDKGYVEHTKSKEGRAFVYRTLVGRDEAGRSAVRYLVSRFFRNSPELLVLNLLKDEKLSEKELGRIRTLLAEDAQ